MKILKNILLISGSGRNCGKTTVACHLISQLAASGRVVGIKITPHLHLVGKMQKLIAEGVGYKIFQETDLHSMKDSSRMLKAGATAVYFIQCVDVDLPKVYEHLKKYIPEDCPIICESGSFANIYKPSLHIFVKGAETDETKTSYRSNLNRVDVILNQEDFNQTTINHFIEFTDMHWNLKNRKHDQVRRSA